MKKWREEEDILFLLLDGNYNINGGPFARMFQHRDIKTKNVIEERTKTDGPPTFVQGSHQIDGAWITPDIGIEAACLLPIFFRVRDHRAILLYLHNVHFLVVIYTK